MANNTIINILKGLLKRFNKRRLNLYKKVGFKWLDVRVIKNLPDNQLNTFKFFNKDLTVYGKAEFLHALNEIFIDEVYKIQLPDNPYIIDCGAHIGFSIIYFKQNYPNAEIVAFEPDEKNFDLLQKNIMSYGYSDVHLKKEAVWIENTMLNFSNEGSMSSKIDQTISAGSIKVKASRLKDYLNRKVSFLKIDIEGAEYIVLKDIEDRLPNVETMFLEYHGSFHQNIELCEIFNIIHNKGFKFYIKEAYNVYMHPFIHQNPAGSYDIQLNIFCFRK